MLNLPASLKFSFLCPIKIIFLRHWVFIDYSTLVPEASATPTSTTTSANTHIGIAKGNAPAQLHLYLYLNFHSHSHTPTLIQFSDTSALSVYSISCPASHGMSSACACMYLCLSQDTSTYVPIFHWRIGSSRQSTGSCVVFPLKLLRYPGNNFCFR